MYVAGVDAHTSYLAVAVVSKIGELREQRRVRVGEPERLKQLLQAYRPLEMVVETSSAWPWLRDYAESEGIGFVLAHAKRLRWIAQSNYKADDVDAELLARMRLSGLIPAVHAMDPEQRDWARLVRRRATLVGLRTATCNRIHAQLHQAGLRLQRGRLLTRAGRKWLREEAWQGLSPEQRRFVRTQMRLLKGLAPMIRWLNPPIEEAVFVV